MNYKKIAPGVYLPETNTPEAVYFEELESHLAELLKQKNNPKPTDLELLEWAKIHHPAFVSHNDNEINDLQNLIEHLKAL